MLILLPPSETKRDGGAGDRLDLGLLSFTSLTKTRRAVIRSVTELSRDREASIRALKLGPKQHAEVDRNRTMRRSPTMPAVERYTGVLYDALDVSTLSRPERAFAHRTVAVHSALFGLVAADDAIPSYRLSFDSRLPETTLKKAWSAPVAMTLAKRDGLILDLRSEGYVALGPLPVREDALYLRVLARDAQGTVRALNHFNKQAKGLFTRALIRNGAELSNTRELLAWSRAQGYDLAVRDGALELVVPEVVGVPGRLMAALR